MQTLHSSLKKPDTIQKSFGENPIHFRPVATRQRLGAEHSISHRGNRSLQGARHRAQRNVQHQIRSFLSKTNTVYDWDERERVFTGEDQLVSGSGVGHFNTLVYTAYDSAWVLNGEVLNDRFERGSLQK